jgi:large subunit ribosomal protein L32
VPVPKRKTSRSVRDSRRAKNNNVVEPTLSLCPQCHAPKVPHRVCPGCGYYKGKEVVETE